MRRRHLKAITHTQKYYGGISADRGMSRRAKRQGNHRLRQALKKDMTLSVEDFEDLVDRKGQQAVDYLRGLSALPTVEEIQSLVLDAGYQWEEHIQNGDKKGRCLLKLTPLTDVFALDGWHEEMICVSSSSRIVSWLDVLIYLRSEGVIK